MNMYTRLARHLVSAAALTACALPAAGQADTVAVDLSGITVANPFPNISRNSAASPAPGSATAINLADGYSFNIDGQIDVDVFGLNFYPDTAGAAPLGGLLDFIEPGQSRLLTGFVRNPGGIPAGGKVVWFESFDGDFSGITLGITLRIEVSASGTVTFSIVNINIPFLFRPFFRINFVSGAGTLTVWEPSTPELTEWHLDGDLLADDRSADAQLRYLDDPAFGPVLGGLGQETVFPAPPTPLGVTDAQSMFVDTATNPSLSAPGGVEDIVFLSSPAFNVGDEGNSSLRRGIGLAMFPSVQPAYPAGFIGAWTMIWDLNIPSSSWFASPGVPRTDLLALVQDQHNNDGGADLWLRTRNGQPEIVYASEGDNFNAMPLTLPASVAPDTWFRLAVAVDEFQRNRSRVYVNGSFVGEILSDWLFNGVNPEAPAYGDGEAVDPADWAAWGNFPAPFAASSNPDAPAFLASTACLFSDLRFGDSQPAYVANLAFTDELLTDSEIAALGGPSGDGIVFLKSDVGGCNAADLSPEFGTLDINDILVFANAFNANDPIADFFPGGGLDINDILNFASAFNAGCP